MDAERKWSDYIREVPAIRWLFVIVGLLVLAGGSTAMAVLSGNGNKVDPGAIIALVTPVLGVVGTHIRYQGPEEDDTLTGDQTTVAH
jgi:hypothetical protein